MSTDEVPPLLHVAGTRKRARGKTFQAGSNWARDLRATVRPAWRAISSRAQSARNFTLHISDELRRVVKPKQGERIRHRLNLEKPFEVFAEDPDNREAMQRALAKVDKIPAKQWRISRTIGNLAKRGQDSQRKFVAYGKYGRAPGADAQAVEVHGALREAMDAVPAGESIGADLTGHTEEEQHRQRDADEAAATAAEAATLGAAAQRAARGAELDGEPLRADEEACPNQHVSLAMEGIRRRKLTREELAKECEDRALETTGTKQVLLTRLTQAIFLEQHKAEVEDFERKQEVHLSLPSPALPPSPPLLAAQRPLMTSGCPGRCPVQELERELLVWQRVEDERRARGDPPPPDDSEEPLPTAAQADAPRATAAAPAFAFGARQLCDAVRLNLVPALEADIVLPGSNSSKIGLKITVDAAFLRASRINDCRNLTTVIVQLLCLGVEGQDWGATAVKHAMHGAQSPKKAFKLRCWFGKDDSVNLLEHFIPYAC